MPPSLKELLILMQLVQIRFCLSAAIRVVCDLRMAAESADRIVKLSKMKPQGFFYDRTVLYEITR